ncbi:hypothetical protein TSUD_215740 [Trifolium subterraneum]|uniref:Uncharacterized protein n=1 Tax=Trifolium subterraneum TaxID=3900 RepID=A0A2Z6MCF3_TRISU|nr:hypothetical protein TSUD_215740 [Trifolium subterraneum]
MTSIRYGRVGEVYIPKKLDKRGRRFAFVKFKEVKEVEELGECLRDVWIGTYKLRVNRSRFTRSEASGGQHPEVQVKGPDEKKVEIKQGKTFFSVLQGSKGIDSKAEEARVLKVPVNKPLRKELEGCKVGVLARERDVKRIQTILFMEGYKSISVTSMGGILVLLQSSVVGDLERLLRSKNECLEYFFSDIKPWSPGLFNVQREVWVHVSGFPLHIWGENFFKMVGAKLGVFLDYDEETASMSRLDKARIKIQTESRAFIDYIFKIEVEGVCFNVWVMEESTGSRNVGTLLEAVAEDRGSLVVPSEFSGDGEEDYGGGGAISGEDDVSGSELDVDVRKVGQHGERTNGERDKDMCGQKPKGGCNLLICEKSTKIADSQEEILPFVSANVSREETAIGQEDTGLACEKNRAEDKCTEGGDDVSVEREKVEEVAKGDIYEVGEKLVPVGPSTHGFIDPVQMGPGSFDNGPNKLGFAVDSTPIAGPNCIEEASHFSSISEPEERRSDTEGWRRLARR